MNKSFLIRLTPCFAAWLCLAVTTVFAQTNLTLTNAAREISTRYLFVVDASDAMRRRAPAVQTAVGNLLRSGMSAQLQRGDTVGIWTFNNTLSAGRFPLQRWSPENKELIASNAVAFLKAQKFTGESKFNLTISALDRLIKESDRLVILLVSDGDEPVSGTPYDPQISQAFHQGYTQQQKARMPFITVLLARRGRMVNASVSLAPWPVTLPEFPPEPKIVEAPKPSPEKKAPARPVVQPLIVIGKKPPATATNLPPAAVTNSIAPTPQPAPASTDSKPAAATTPSPTAPTIEVSPSVPTVGAVTSATRPETLTPTPPALTPSVVVAAEKSTIVQSTTKPDLAPPVPTTPAEIKPTPAPTTSEIPKPAVPTAEATLPSRSEAVPIPPADFAAAPAEMTNDPAQAAVVVTPESAFSRWGLAAIGGGLILLAIWFFFAMRQRAHSSERVSLITRSMDRGGE
jgi:hypothetical protein